jgi:hypothetical protein
VFFSIHDPTTPNRRARLGTQYRSRFFCQTQEQRATAESVIADLTAAGCGASRSSTEIAEAAPFRQAERYHQEYFARNPGRVTAPSSSRPKVAKFRKHFTERLKPGLDAFCASALARTAAARDEAARHQARATDQNTGPMPIDAPRTQRERHADRHSC